MTDDLRRPQLRALQYFYVDGTFEFGFGLLCLALATFFYLETRVQGWLSALVDGSLVLVMIGGVWLAQRLMKRIKERLTYPRSGYLAYRREQGGRRGWRVAASLVIGGLVASIAAVLVTRPHPGMDVMSAFTGLVMGLVLAFIGLRAALPRLVLVAGASVVLGLGLSYSGLGNEVGLAAYYLTIAMLLFISGGLTLWAYLRGTSAPQPE